MSLDVYLNTMEKSIKDEGSGIFIRENGSTKEISRKEWDEKFPGREPVTVLGCEDETEVFTRNITHNLNAMADAAGIYKHLWRPEEIGITKAEQLIEPLTEGLRRLKETPGYFKDFNPANGWGDYDGLVKFVAEYLGACVMFPDADVSIWR